MDGLEALNVFIDTSIFGKMNFYYRHPTFKSLIDHINNERFLSRYGIWGGKYPTPINNENDAVTTVLSDGEHYVVGGYNPVVIPSYLEFAVSWYEWAEHETNEKFQSS
jgi:hypothetical protein